MEKFEEKIKELEAQNAHLRTQNLQMRLDFEVLIDFPYGKAAEKILRKYGLKRKIREEALRIMKN
jgi:hypothetical protein